MKSSSFAEEILSNVVASSKLDGAWFTELDQIPAPIYVVDAEGVVTYYNSQCVTMAGRVPQVGEDRWCVTWKLFTNSGELLPHDKCPMAEAVRRLQTIRGKTATVERPDGTRTRVMPFPTPLFDDEDRLIGAVNMVVDIDERQHPGDLRRQAERYFQLARALGDPEISAKLDQLATQCQIKACALDLLDPAA